ncbi:uncharacterized protein LOC119688982 [Teleopsis dalmanni]|uniref:uncharacterized protein LOC119688982 n=1 Tax=Teleopsis dalmanni TaxID=139649 RepID=UPI0018CCB42B|nr:uncharacterized protein LOC119688982 [Teleopsis dalmanni]
MDLRRFCEGGGDVDSLFLNLLALPNYYDLPIIGGRYAAEICPNYQVIVQRQFEQNVRSCHIRLRRQMGIPDTAFEFFRPHVPDNENILNPLVFTEEYSRNNRAKQLRFQAVLDFFVRKYYNEAQTELLQMIHSRTKMRYCILAAVAIGAVLWYGYHKIRQN